MFLSEKAKNFQIFFYLTITCCLVSSDDIPTILWNIKGNSLPIKPASALGHNDKVLTENLNNVLHQDSRILVFTVNKLSLEDFSFVDNPATQNNTLRNVEAFLDSQPHLLLSSVKDPLNHIHRAHCGVQEIVVDNNVDDSVLQAVSKAIQRSCVVVLHISDEGIVPGEGNVQNVFTPLFENSNKNIVGIFTGVKSSWSGSENEHHKFRNLLQAENPDKDKFVNISSCLIMYCEKASIKLAKDSNSTDLPFPATTTGSKCGSSNESLLQLEFKTSGNFSSVTLKLTFNKERGSWKTDGTVSYTRDGETKEDIELKTDFIGAALGFSYSCGNLVIGEKNSTGEKQEKLEITMERFQVQPYEVKESDPLKFSDSFDCVPFFTIPIWMGVIVSLIFIVIINIGIYALFSVHTMDRFDDPKGKTITVGAAAD